MDPFRYRLLILRFPSVLLNTSVIQAAMGNPPTSNPRKRHAPSGNDEGTPHVRKRERYTRAACNLCKARKVRCSGISPCNRCTETRSECTFAETATLLLGTQDLNVRPEWAMRLENSMETLNQRLLRLPTSTLHDSPCTRKTRTPAWSNSEARVIFPSVDTFQLHRPLLEQRLHVSAENKVMSTRSPVPKTSNDTPPMILMQAAQPILALNYDTALLYIEKFGSDILTTYPCVSLDLLRSNLKALFQATSPASLNVSDSYHYSVSLAEIEILKVAIAVGAAGEDEVKTALGSDLSSYISWSVDSMTQKSAIAIEDVTIACLLSIYYLVHEEPLQAWRLIGVAARGSLELRLHKPLVDTRSSYGCNEEQARRLLFCCICEIDGRSGLMCNLPRTLTSQIIDESKLLPDSDYPYLAAMFKLNKLNAEALDMTTPKNLGSQNLDDDQRASFLDYQLHRVVNSHPVTPTNLSDDIPSISNSSQSCVLGAFTQLRANLIRVMAYRASLNSVENAKCQPRSVQILVTAAREIIQTYIDTKRDYAIARYLRAPFELAAHVATCFLLLAATYNPTPYVSLCKDIFSAGIDMLNTSAHTITQQEDGPWYLLGNLRRLAEHIGLLPCPNSLSEAEGYGVNSSTSEMSFLENAHEDIDALVLQDMNWFNNLLV
ncbi:hypothetical protein B0J11DRAFT_563657 [Dendryphion nanum]|uniref:Zn(2)-C6 fungal-type domain-containing protein n=1 Tax=Dendryphion nanum TaxID=256645 RepID=A0A9P9J297_9PLEO|nr:hypothetical protein B0J11DRAFT_563657 [Dendryphion nanum]